MYPDIDTLPGDVLIKELLERTADKLERFEVVRIEQKGAQTGPSPEVVVGSRQATERARELVAADGAVVRVFLSGSENLVVSRDRM